MNRIIVTFEASSGDVSCKKTAEIPAELAEKFAPTVANWITGAIKNHTFKSALEDASVKWTIEKKGGA